MPVLLFVAFVLVPIAELYVIIQVGQAIGVLPTLALLVVDSLLGTYLLKREGSRAWQALQESLRARRMPARCSGAVRPQVGPRSRFSDWPSRLTGRPTARSSSRAWRGTRRDPPSTTTGRPSRPPVSRKRRASS